MTLKQRQEKTRLLQVALADATAAIDRAKLLANELESPFEFLGRIYTPLKVVTGGHFDHEPAPNTTESWDESDDSWQNSGCVGY